MQSAKTCLLLMPWTWAWVSPMARRTIARLPPITAAFLANPPSWAEKVGVQKGIPTLFVAPVAVMLPLLPLRPLTVALCSLWTLDSDDLTTTELL